MLSSILNGMGEREFEVSRDMSRHVRVNGSQSSSSPELN